jgi:hypothetical protein
MVMMDDGTLWDDSRFLPAKWTSRFSIANVFPPKLLSRFLLPISSRLIEESISIVDVLFHAFGPWTMDGAPRCTTCYMNMVP